MTTTTTDATNPQVALVARAKGMIGPRLEPDEQQRLIDDGLAARDPYDARHLVMTTEGKNLVEVARVFARAELKRRKQEAEDARLRAWPCTLSDAELLEQYDAARHDWHQRDSLERGHVTEKGWTRESRMILLGNEIVRREGQDNG